MIRVLGLILLLLSAYILGAPDWSERDVPQEPPAVATRSPLFEVSAVIDGDTIIVKTDQGEEMVRLLGIDTPEVDARFNPVECFGSEATNETRRLLAGARVTLQADPTQDNKDRFDRLLRFVFLEDGTNVNEHLIEGGFAKEYTFNTPYTYQASFRQAQADAQAKKLGLWSKEACPE